jgi:hypothetical protein
VRYLVHKIHAKPGHALGFERSEGPLLIIKVNRKKGDWPPLQFARPLRSDRTDASISSVQASNSAATT